MPVIIPGTDTQQKTLTVTANDEAMNDAITAEAEGGWIVSLLVLNGSDMVILFTRNVLIPEEST